MRVISLVQMIHTHYKIILLLHEIFKIKIQLKKNITNVEDLNLAKRFIYI